MSETLRVGAQRPTHLLTPDGDFDFSDGDDAIELAVALGLDLFDWQAWLVRWILAVDADGRLACNTVFIIVPRQNGKGTILEVVELYWLLVAGVKNVTHTAHEAESAALHHVRLDGLTAEPSIDIPALRSYKANGKERIENLDEGLLLKFRTRTKTTSRGASPQRIVLDECQELQDEHLGALVPGLAAQSLATDHKLPQLLYTGSAPLEHSLYMHRLLRNVQELKPARTLLAMWACSADDDHDDPDNLYRANPSLGLLISEDWVRNVEQITMSAVDFAAERLGVPKGGGEGGDGPINTERWSQLVDADSLATDDTIALGLDAPIGRESAVFAAVGKRPDKLGHMAIRYWLPVARLGELVEIAGQLSDGHGACINIPAKSPALAWHAKLTEAGVPVAVIGERDLVQAEQAIEQDIADGSIRHRGQLDLSVAVDGLAARTNGDTSPWSRRSSAANIAPMMAAAAARAGGRGKTTTANPETQIF